MALLRGRRRRVRRRDAERRPADGLPVGRHAMYLPAYPLHRLSRCTGSRASHFRRDTTVDSAIVALAASAVIWQWVVTPVVDQPATAQRSSGSSPPRIRSWTSARGGDRARGLHTPAVGPGGLVPLRRARRDARRRHRLRAARRRQQLHRRCPLDALWPIAYFLLAAAVLHPSMRDLWYTRDTGSCVTGGPA